jgi:hypothetical protein
MVLSICHEPRKGLAVLNTITTTLVALLGIQALVSPRLSRGPLARPVKGCGRRVNIGQPRSDHRLVSVIGGDSVAMQGIGVGSCRSGGGPEADATWLPDCGLLRV